MKHGPRGNLVDSELSEVYCVERPGPVLSEVAEGTGKTKAALTLLRAMRFGGRAEITFLRAQGRLRHGENNVDVPYIKQLPLMEYSLAKSDARWGV